MVQGLGQAPRQPVSESVILSKVPTEEADNLVVNLRPDP
tara:strand:- start:5039 stop:5155 length:117 start_codon:yes stop_codon:yes gene_type:complete